MSKVLVVDDNEPDRCVLQTLLMRNGYDVILAGDGAEALKVARDNPPDLIIADILMPGMDGYALCRQWKREEKLKKVPFVFYTSTYTDPKDEQLALDMGADRFIRKPQELDALLGILKDVIEQHKAGRQTPAPEPVLEEKVYLREYNAALVRKLEDKLVQLESAKASLETEISGHTRAAHDLEASEMRYRRLFETAKDGILILDAGTGRIVDVNPFLADLLGFTPEYFLGKELCEIGLFKDIAASEAAFFELQEKGYIRYDDLPLRTRGGRQIDVEFVSNVYSVNSTKVVQCNIRDITERKRAEEEIRNMAKFPSENPNPILRIARDGTLLYVNEAGLRLLPDWHLQVGQPAPPMPRKAVLQAMDGGSARMLDLNCRARVYSFSVAPIADTDYANLYARDITERKRAEEKLKNQLEELQRWHDVMLDREGRVQELKSEVNEICRRMGETPRYPSQEAGAADAEIVEAKS